MQYLAVLGRQPKISLAELESLFHEVRPLGATSGRAQSGQTATALATFQSDTQPNLNRLGGTVKLAQKLDGPVLNFLMNLPEEGKLTFGLSDYTPGATTASTHKEAMRLKKTLTRHGRSVRTLYHTSPVLSSATVHHNQLGEKPLHFELIKLGRDWYLGLGVQNITAYAKRDQARPARDAKVGMLPPKLAQILINLCGPLPAGTTLLDPFCGTGVLLQEALLMGYRVVGSDVSDRMIKYTEKNLAWLGHSAEALLVGDATTTAWPAVGAVACETYLGPPMSAPPADLKLKTVRAECGHLALGFLKNLAPQLRPGTPVVLAVPAWRRTDGTYSRLNILDEITEMGYNVVKYQNLGQRDMLYFRDGQVVAREIIALRKK